MKFSREKKVRKREERPGLTPFPRRRPQPTRYPPPPPSRPSQCGVLLDVDNRRALLPPPPARSPFPVVLMTSTLHIFKFQISTWTVLYCLSTVSAFYSAVAAHLLCVWCEMTMAVTDGAKTSRTKIGQHLQNLSHLQLFFVS